MKNRTSVLLIAYACRPGESSEREVGWRWANTIQRHHDVTVLTRETHRPFIEAYFSSGDKNKSAPEFLYFDLPGWLSGFKKGERGLRLYYALWSLCGVLKGRWMNRDGHWKITHFLTFGTLLWPQFAFLMNNAYVLGPVGGGERIPFSLRKSFGISGQFKILFRRLIQKGLFLNPIYWANIYRADKIFVRTKETFDIIPYKYKKKTELLLETAVVSEMELSNAPDKDADVLQIIAVGRIISSKFNSLMFEALDIFKAKWNKPFRVKIIGDGPERSRLEALRDKLGLHEVEFVGQKAPDEVLSELRHSDVYFSTTMKEAGSWAFFEAVANRVPVVCLKVNGPDMIIGDGCGIKIIPSNYVQCREDLAAGLLKLAHDPALRERYAKKALGYLLSNFTWDQVAERVDAAYAQVLSVNKIDIK